MTERGKTSVCIIVENLPVPLDRRVWREACALRDAGYRVSVICPKGKDSCTAPHEVLDEIEIYRHRAFEASTVAGYLLEYSWAMLAELFLALKVFARTRFRVLQACNPPDTIFVIGLLFKLFGVRFIFDQHDLAPELFEAKFGTTKGLLSRTVRALESSTYRLADVCIVTNDSFKDVAVSRGRKVPEDVFVVRNCPSLAFIRPKTPTGDRFGKRYLVAYVGFMGSQDGLDLLIESADHIVNGLKREDVHFVLVGGGTVLDDLRKMIADRKLESYISLTGQVPHQKVAEYLSNADIGVAPDPKNSLNDNSTMIKIFEYMAFRLPVVQFDLKEGRRTAGEASVYAEPNDPIDFGNRVVELLEDQDARERMGQLGRRRIEETLNWETEKLSLVRAYETALKSDDAVLRQEAAR